MKTRRRRRFRMPDEREPLRWLVGEAAWALFWLGIAAFGAMVVAAGD